MKQYVIYVNQKPYMGEDPEQTYGGGDCWSNKSFHTKPQDLNILKFGGGGDTPKLIFGIRGLRSEIDRIARRVEDGMIAVDEILIRLV